MGLRIEHSGWKIDSAHGLQIMIGCIDLSTNHLVNSKTASEPFNIEGNIIINQLTSASTVNGEHTC